MIEGKTERGGREGEGKKRKLHANFSPLRIQRREFDCGARLTELQSRFELAIGRNGFTKP